MSLREQGNDAFKKQEYATAVDFYMRAELEREGDWLLAVSNRGICHNRTGNYTGALAAADMVLKDKPHFPKACRTLATALMGLITAAVKGLLWLEVMDLTSRLRAPDLWAHLLGDQQLEARVQEMSWRKNRTQHYHATTKMNVDDENPGFDCMDGVRVEAPPGLAHRTQNGTSGKIPFYEFRLQSSFRDSLQHGLDCLGRTMEGVAMVHVIGARDEDPRMLAELFRVPRGGLCMIGPEAIYDAPVMDVRTSRGCTVRCMYDTALYHDSANIRAAPSPQVAVMFCPPLSSMFESMLPTVKLLIDSGALTVVTGYNRDGSLVENESILEALGAKMVLKTKITDENVQCRIQVPGEKYSNSKNNHVCAFEGRGNCENPIAKADIQKLKRELIYRGFEIPASDEPRGSYFRRR